MSVPYTVFHWGFSAWTLYALAGIPIAYHFHVRKNRGSSLSDVVSAITGLNPTGVAYRIIDILFIFICFGGLSITLGVSVPLATDVLCSVSGSAGCFLYFGVLGSLPLERQLSGVIDMVGLLADGKDTAASIAVMRSLPFGAIFMLIFCICSLLFLATTLDGATFTMTSTSSIGLKNNKNPNPFLRLFWCIMLSLVPLTMIFIDAVLNTIKTCAFITAVPIIFIMIVMLWGWIKWMFHDFGKTSSADMEKALRTAKEEDA